MKNSTKSEMKTLFISFFGICAAILLLVVVGIFRNEIEEPIIKIVFTVGGAIMVIGLALLSIAFVLVSLKEMLEDQDDDIDNKLKLNQLENKNNINKNP